MSEEERIEERDKVVSTAEEMLRCKTNPYYFAKKYVTVNGKPFTTRLSEYEFNDCLRLYERSDRYKDFERKSFSETIMDFTSSDPETHTDEGIALFGESLKDEENRMIEFCKKTGRQYTYIGGSTKNPKQ